MLLQLKPKELDAVSSHWYIKFGTHWAGPISYIEVLQMLKNKKISRTAYIRCGDSRARYGGNWYPMSEVEEFSTQFISTFSRCYVPAGRPFNRIRKFVRVQYDAEILIVNNEGEVIKSLCSELSAGGAKIRVPAGSLDENQALMIHFFYNSSLKLKSFKAKARVLRLCEISFEDTKKDVYEVYALEFEELRPRHKKMLFEKHAG